ncbi:MAG: c-type cytochrome [Planctomycetaceae bacterium]
MKETLLAPHKFLSRLLSAFVLGAGLWGALLCLSVSSKTVIADDAQGSVSAQPPPSNVGPLIGLIQKGSLPEARLPGVVKVVCERGNEHDLAVVFQEVVRDEHWNDSLRTDTLNWLFEASTSRKVKPVGELDALSTLIGSTVDAKLQVRAIKLAGQWKVAAVADKLEVMIASPETAETLREAAVDAVVALGGAAAQRAIDTMLKPTQPTSVRFRGVAALASINLKQAVSAATTVLKSASSEDDPAPLMQALLQQKGGADLFATGLEADPPEGEVALLLLRQMYALGRNDASLDKVLSRLAGVNDIPPKPDEAGIRTLAARAEAEGDAVRGEAVFRRADLACMKCHAVSKAGGIIGPDLSAVGASSPVDYLVKSILDPDAQKKEEYITRIIIDADGVQTIGIVENRTADKITLKTADGKHVSIATADIEVEAEGSSLMPEGLVRFMTERELLDVVKFLSQLGKPGTDYAIRSTQRMQRWRTLQNSLERFQGEVPNEELFGDLVLNSTDWQPVYARTNGDLPLADAAGRSKQRVLFVQGEINVTRGGAIVVHVDDPTGLNLWIESTSVDLAGSRSMTVEPGRHRITLRVDTKLRETPTLKLVVDKAADSSAEFTVVDGP